MTSKVGACVLFPGMLKKERYLEVEESLTLLPLYIIKLYSMSAICSNLQVRLFKMQLYLYFMSQFKESKKILLFSIYTEKPCVLYKAYKRGVRNALE